MDQLFSEGCDLKVNISHLTESVQVRCELLSDSAPLFVYIYLFILNLCNFFFFIVDLCWTHMLDKLKGANAPGWLWVQIMLFIICRKHLTAYSEASSSEEIF